MSENKCYMASWSVLSCFSSLLATVLKMFENRLPGISSAIKLVREVLCSRLSVWSSGFPRGFVD